MELRFERHPVGKERRKQQSKEIGVSLSICISLKEGFIKGAKTNLYTFREQPVTEGIHICLRTLYLVVILTSTPFLRAFLVTLAAMVEQLMQVKPAALQKVILNLDEIEISLEELDFF